VSRKIQRLLIANRGEIAVRIIRAARELGIVTIAIYSTVDRTSPHVRLANEAYNLGDPDPSASYLNIEKILNIAISKNVDAIHPGYGFLSENPDFNEQVEKAGIIFIGPGLAAMKLMGDKILAREVAFKASIPLIPGSIKPVETVTEALKVADKLGYPVLVKASAGGGGKGMRKVDSKESMKESFLRARSEAYSAFGNDSVYIEKFIEKPHHIEIQILADNFGNYIHLNERECSIQRRHQKLIEESPSPLITKEIRNKLAASAIAIAKASNYSNAGTVEFIIDSNLNYYFLEMNTRLQVEHPVTEEITGIDLVKQQIRIAENKKLLLKQDSIHIKKHAIELRIYAEDPENDFLPSTGILEVYRPPKGPGIRVDDGYEEGMSIPIQYDPMLAKLIVTGGTREEAIIRMKYSIEEFIIMGVPNTLQFGHSVMNDSDFINGSYNTNYIQECSTKIDKQTSERTTRLAAAMASHLFMNKKENQIIKDSKNNTFSQWKKRRL